MPPYNIPHTTVTSSRHWKILRCLREHTPFPMTDPHPDPDPRPEPHSQTPTSVLLQNFRPNFEGKKREKKKKKRILSRPSLTPPYCTLTRQALPAASCALNRLLHLLLRVKSSATCLWNPKGAARFSDKVQLSAARIAAPSPYTCSTGGTFGDAVPVKLDPQAADEASMAPITPVTCQKLKKKE